MTRLISQRVSADTSIGNKPRNARVSICSQAIELYSKPIPRGASGESYDSVKYHDTPPAVLEKQRPSRKNPRVQSKGFSGKRENRCATIVPLA